MKKIMILLMLVVFCFNTVGCSDVDEFEKDLDKTISDLDRAIEALE